MGAHNGHEVYLDLLLSLMRDLEHSYPSFRLSIQRDVVVIKHRFENEGLGFLTKTLPRLGKAIDKALSSGRSLEQDEFHKHPHSGLPAFLRSFLIKVFNKKGELRTEPDVGAIQELRQVCYLFYKLEVPYEEATVASKVDAFIDIDNHLPLSLEDFPRESWDILRRARVLCRLLLKDFSLRGAKPKHGPGSVAGGEKPWEKMDFKYFVHQIDSIFPVADFFFLSPTHLCDELESLERLIPVDHLYSKLAAVNKDSRGPRLIGMEPNEYMFVQPQIKGKLYEYLESHPLTKGHVNFQDQTINRRLALEASRDRLNATLDLKDASDSVALILVTFLLGDVPHLLEALLATRTPGIKLPSGQTLVYRKFAPMGSALCFPVEALCFWALVSSILMERCSLSQNIALKSVYIYGDDIIVPTATASAVMEWLPKFGLIPNKDKCSIAGPFRESCGCDAVNGYDVTPTKVKALWPFPVSKGNGRSDRADPGGVASYVE